MYPEYWGAWTGAVILGVAAFLANAILFYYLSGGEKLGFEGWILAIAGLRAVPGLV
jgi:hypothetical protein